MQRIQRDSQADITSTAAREYAELDILVAEAFVERRIDQYHKLAKLRFDYGVRMRLIPTLHRSSITDDDDNPTSRAMAASVDAERKRFLIERGVIKEDEE